MEYPTSEYTDELTEQQQTSPEYSMSIGTEEPTEAAVGVDKFLRAVRGKFYRARVPPMETYGPIRRKYASSGIS